MENRHIDLIARTQDDDLIERNEKVLIVSVEDGIAQVTKVRGLGPQDTRKHQRAALKN